MQLMDVRKKERFHSQSFQKILKTLGSQNMQKKMQKNAHFPKTFMMDKNKNHDAQCATCVFSPPIICVCVCTHARACRGFGGVGGGVVELHRNLLCLKGCLLLKLQVQAAVVLWVGRGFGACRLTTQGSEDSGWLKWKKNSVEACPFLAHRHGFFFPSSTDMKTCVDNLSKMSSCQQFCPCTAKAIRLLKKNDWE